MDLSMQVEERTFWRKMDWNFVFVILALNLVGLINLYSATSNPGSLSASSVFINQIVWLVGGWSLFFLITLIDYQIVSRLAVIVYSVNVLALVYVTFKGDIALGAQRWIDFGLFKYQPSETMKLGLIMMTAKFLHRRNTHGPGMGVKELLYPIGIILIPFGLVVKQPDLGTALMLAAIGGSLILFAKVKKRILFSAVILGLCAAALGWNYGLREYQKDRVRTFLDPERDPRGSSYHTVQSKIAVGSGKLVGKGFRKGTQSQLEFLPERHTDFIFAVLSEEHGFIGSITTLSLFIVLFFMGIRIASTARDKFGAMLTVGVLAYVFWHMLVNVGMVLGLLPIVGVPLPLLSYGGSSMLTTMTGMGLISSVAYRRYLF